LSYPDTNVGFHTILILPPKVFIIAFSVVSRTSFENVVSKWYPEVSLHVPNAPIVLVGTKIDLRDDMKEIEKLKKEGTEPITRKEGEELAAKIGAYSFGECSAKNKTGLKDVFSVVIEAHINPKKETIDRRKVCLVL